MNVYDFKKLEKCYVCGSIDKNIDRFIHNVTSNLLVYEKKQHPKELERQKRLENRETRNNLLSSRLRQADYFINAAFKDKSKKEKPFNYNNSVIIVSGNCGIGSKSMKYYEDMFEKLNNALVPNNCFVLFVRGNNDDPSIFNECKIDFSNVKTIPDYSVVILKPFNCLCIGGSVSIDKEWKLSQEKFLNKKLYWENESPFFNENELDEILSKYQIGCVITSTSPTFTFPGTNAYNKSRWLKGNSEMKTILSNERKLLDRIYDKIMNVDTKPYVWLYGKFKQSNINKVNDIVFESLSQFQIEDVKEIMSRFFGVDLSKKLGGNVFTFDTFIADHETCGVGAPRFHEINQWNEDEIEEDVEGVVGEEEMNQIEMDVPDFTPADFTTAIYNRDISTETAHLNTYHEPLFYYQPTNLNNTILTTTNAATNLTTTNETTNAAAF